MNLLEIKINYWKFILMGILNFRFSKNQTTDKYNLFLFFGIFDILININNQFKLF